MFSLSRSLFAFLLLILGGVYIFFQFHGTISIATSTIINHLKSTNERISTTALNNNYAVTIKEGKPKIRIPPLPDFSRFTIENVAAHIPPFSPGKVTITDMKELPDLCEFIKKDGRIQHHRLAQLTILPQAIHIQSGHYNLTHLYEEVKKLTTENILEKIDTRYLLRLPILIGEKASLTISGMDTDELLLSQEQSAFITNAGKLFILRTKITGWNEKGNHPAFFKNKHIFRPFLVNWNGAHMHIAGSTLANLGYHKSKSYGITYSSCTPCLRDIHASSASTGSLIGNTFFDLYYGFYSYEAEGIIILRNTYIDNIIYGIDPHDRSRHLLIAENEVFGSKKKHGIIISREVKDSWILSNYSHHNQGTGIMLDRSGENNVVINNVSAYNTADGITFFESPNNISYNNKIYQNGLSGIRIRNSWNIKLINEKITGNGSVPIVMYILNLANHNRDFKLDPYTMKADAVFSGIVIKTTNDKPALKIDGIDSLVLSNIHLLSGGPIFSGHLFSDEKDIRGNINTPQKTVIIKKKQPSTNLSKKESAP